MGAPVGNQNAKKVKPFADAINRAIAQDDGKRLREIAEKLLTMAADGEIAAIKELADRTDGKAIQAIAGDPDQPIHHRIERVIVDAKE